MAEFIDAKALGYDPDVFKTALMSYEEFRSKERILCLGIDLGIKSLGIALVDIKNHEIILMASHIFAAPENPKNHVSLAASRRADRSSRRTLQRKKNRKKAGVKLFKQCGLVPEDISNNWFAQQPGEPDLLSLRVTALSERIADRDFARILYSFLNRRGYIDHSASEGGDTDADGKKILTAISANRALLAERNYETIAQLLADEPTSRNHKDDYAHTADNELIQDEVHAIFKHQRDFGNPKATREFEEKYISCLTWLTDTTKRDERIYRSVGYCTYLGEPYKRAPKAAISNEKVCAYERLSNTVIIHENGSESRIPTEMRNEIVDELFSVKKSAPSLKYSKLRKQLKLADTDSFKKIPVEEEKKRDCVALPSWNMLCRHLYTSHRSFLNRLHEDTDLADRVVSALVYSSSRQSLETQLLELNLTDFECSIVLELPYASKLYSDYCSTSLKALQMLCDAFEDPAIKSLTDAEMATGLDAARQSQTEKLSAVSDGLLCPYEQFDPTCSNPVVLRALSRMRKVVNSIIRHYGTPDYVRIELARELASSKKQKENIEKRQKFNKNLRDQAAKDIREFRNLSEDTKLSQTDILKIRLYNEQKGKDPYTNEELEFEKVLNQKDYAQIDHILPISRSANDSFSNKVLVRTSSNQNKGQRTPYEWMTSGEATAPDFDEFAARVAFWKKNAANRHAANRKSENLLNKSFTGGEGFISRSLNDTRYMSSMALKWVKTCLDFPDDGKEHAFAVNGGCTANMRNIWDIGIRDESGKKDRSDNRHHAVDAAVIACCTPGIVQKVSKARSGSITFNEKMNLINNSLPYPEFKSQVEAWIPCIVPTYYAPKNVTGELLQATTYRYMGKNGKNQELYKKSGQKPKPAAKLHFVDEKSVKLYGNQYGTLLSNTAQAGKKVKWTLTPIFKLDVSKRPKDPKALVLRYGDILCVDGHVGRYRTYDRSIKMFYHLHNGKVEPLQKTGPLATERIPNLRTWSKPEIMQEDCLGLCWLRFLKERAENKN